MKAKFLKGILVAMASTLLFSCSSSDGIEVSQTQTTETLIPVSIGFKGEVLSLSEQPLSRVGDAKDTENSEESKDWYRIQVYSKPDSIEYEYYTPYAYGYFDNKENMTINLKPGYKYKFAVDMCVKAADKIAEYIEKKDTFILSSDYMINVESGNLSLDDGYFNRPDIDRFFGEAKDYTPVEGGHVDIDMKRVAFGVKFVAKNFNSGSLEIKMNGAPTINMNAEDYPNAEEKSSEEKRISFSDLEYAYLITTGVYSNPANPDDHEYAESIPVSITWTTADGKKVPVANQDVNFKRNKLTIVTFEVKDNTIDTGIDITEDEAFSNEVEHKDLDKKEE